MDMNELFAASLNGRKGDREDIRQRLAVEERTSSGA